MSIERATIAGHLHNKYSALAQEIGQDGDGDDVTGYSYDIDQALRDLGYTASQLAGATISDAQTPAALALAEYHALDRFRSQLALRVNVRAGSLAQDLSHQTQALGDMVDRAYSRALDLGYPPGGVQAIVRDTLNLDIIEPDPTI